MAIIVQPAPGTITWDALDTKFIPRTSSSGQPFYYDETDSFAPNDAPVVIKRKHTTAPSGMQSVIYALGSGMGTNTGFKGISTGVFLAVDSSAIPDENGRGVLYALQANVQPHYDRTNSPADDVVGLTVFNSGYAKATDGIYVGRSRTDLGTNPTALDWGQVFQVDAWADTLFRANGHYTTGISLNNAVISGPAIKLANGQSIAALKADGVNVRDIVKLTTSDHLELYAARVTVNNGGGITLANVTAIPVAPAAGSVVLYSDAGVLKARTPNGTITTLAS